jgi:aryl-alcohol dehydrogenase-like predicted oxidoreductase
MQTRKLGRHGPPVSAIGLSFPCSLHQADSSYRENLNTALHFALDSEISLFELYDNQHDQNSLSSVHDVLSTRKRDNITISLTYGAVRNSTGSLIGLDVSPQSMKTAVDRALDLLKLDYIDIVQPARLNSKESVEESVRSISSLVEAGYVRHIGLPHVAGALLRAAHSIHPISWILTEYSLASRDIEKDLIPVARELGIAIGANNVMHSGVFSNNDSPVKSNNGTDRSVVWPPFRGDHDDLFGLLEAVQRCAEEKNVSTAQIAIAWLLAQGKDVIPLIRTSQQLRMKQAIDAIGLTLTAEDLSRIDASKSHRLPTVAQ